MHDPIDFFQANLVLVLANPIALSPISDRTVENRNCVRSRPVGFHPDAKTCGPPRTGTVGPASRPAAGAMLTLLRLSRSPPPAGANFLRPARDNRPPLRTRAGLRFIRRIS